LIDATFLIPTHRHVELLTFALRSALGQDGVEIEVFVVGDGVEDATRVVMEPFLRDARFASSIFQKASVWARRTATSRSRSHEVASSRISATTTSCCRATSPRCHASSWTRTSRTPSPVVVNPDGRVDHLQIDLSRHEFIDRMFLGRSRIGLTGASHTREAYDRLPHGWRPAPPNVYADLYIWLQWCAQPWFLGRTGRHVTALHFPDPIGGTSRQSSASPNSSPRGIAAANPDSSASSTGSSKSMFACSPSISRFRRWT
jgi:hypothetical protein